MSVIWTPESGYPERRDISIPPQPEVRGIAWNNLLLNDDSYGVKWKTAADIQITPDKALASTVVLACCRILAETISSLDLNLYRRLPDGSKTIATESPLHLVLHRKPNGWQTQMEWMEQIVMHLTLWGNSYSQILSGKYGAVSQLWNLHPSRMTVERIENGRIRYRYSNPQNGKQELYTQDEIMHVRWTAEPDGLRGMVPIEISRDAIALARVLEIHAAKFWANSARPGVVLQTDGNLSAEAAERLRDNWERLHRGAEKAARTAILTNGLKVQEVGFSNEASQYDSTRAFQTAEICRIYRLPLYLVQGDAPTGDIEGKGQDFLTYTLIPWLRRIEQAISRSLIINDDLYVAAFDTKTLLRANSNSRASFYSTMTGLGIYSINDCRKLEGLPPIPDGDKHFVAMNQQTLEEAVKPKPDPSQTPGAPPPAQGGVPSQPEVKKLAAPAPAEQGQASQPKYEDAVEQKYYEAEEQRRSFCPTGKGGGVDNSCGKGSEKFTPASEDNARHITIPSDDTLRDALSKHKIDKVGDHRDLEPGTKVALRIDIPAYQSKGVYAVTVHKHTSGKSVGQPIGYDSVVRLKGDIEFVSDEAGAEKINAGQAKYPLATVKGEFDPDRSIPGDINDWVAVGYNPKKAAYFYDKKTGKEVTGGTDSISVGNSVFVRTAKYGPRSVAKQYRAMSFWDVESRDADCGRDDGGQFDEGNRCAVEDGVLKPKSTEAYSGEASYRDEDDDHVYHVTTRGGARKILADGFKKPEGPGTIKGGFYESYSKGKVFFTEKSGLATWKDKVEDHLFHSHDDPPPVAVVRVKKSEVSHLLENDEEGTRDAGSSAYFVDLTGKAKRSYCPTGEGGGIDNSCGSKDGGGSSKQLPEGTKRYRDAIDSASPAPHAVWDRSRGRADTPSAEVIDRIAEEQTSHAGKELTPEAEKAYGSLIDEIGRQYEALMDTGLKIHAWKGEGEPYGDPPGSTKPNSDKMRDEIAKTGEYSFFMTEKGFGTGEATPDHPMLRETKYKTADGEPLIANDLFRIVHDLVAHVRGGYSFSTNGEFNGMLTHASTLPASAWPALFAETFGQNAVYEKTGKFASQHAYASKVGPEIIKSELAKRDRTSSRSEHQDGDEPLGYQHCKCRPWMMDGVESRAYCKTGKGGGIDNSCSSKGGGGNSSEPPRESADGNESGGGPDFNRIARAILKSIEATGGYTIHPITAESPTTGYMVATVPAAEHIVDSTKAVTGDLIRAYYAKHQEHIANDPALHLGGWFDENSDQVYLDLSTRFDDLDDAIDAAEKHKQLAIWDLSNKSEIRNGDYDARRTRPRKGPQEARSVRLPSGRWAGRDRGGDRGNEGQGSRGKEGPRGGRREVRSLLTASLREAGYADDQVSAFVDLYDRAIEVRADDNCGRAEGGKFGPHNTCQEEGDHTDVKAGPHSGSIKELSDANHEAIKTFLDSAGDPEIRRVVIGGVLKQVGYADSTCDDMGSLAVTAFPRNKTISDQVAAATAVLLAAANISKEPQREGIFVSSSQGMAARFGGDPRKYNETAAFYTNRGDTVEINTTGLPEYLSNLGRSEPGYLRGRRDADMTPFYSVNHPSHVIYHELGHALHYRHMREAAGLSRGLLNDDDFRKLGIALKVSGMAAASHANSTPGFHDELKTLSWAAVINPMETMAEYYAKVRLTGERSKKLDEFAKKINFPMKELTRAARLGKKVKL